MDPKQPLALLGGLSPAAFVRRHWQKKPLLIRAALHDPVSPIGRAELFALAGREGVESRLIQHTGGTWKLRHGPLPRRALPPLRRPGWTLLLQGLDLHCEAAHELLARFRFLPEARLDDLMISYASDGGGVGAHLDAYDVFLLQVQGRRRWRIGPAEDRALCEGLPLKILRHFRPDQEHLLEPGDMLYLPPGWAHDGVAEGGECMTCSIGFRAPSASELARELLPRLGDALAAGECEPRYRDRADAATANPGRLPAGLGRFARAALRRALADERALDLALGEASSEPKPQVWFEPGARLPATPGAVRLDRRTRMVYDARHVFINGESIRAAGRDATLMQRLADARGLDGIDLQRASAAARGLLDDWARAGWLHAADAQSGGAS